MKILFIPDWRKNPYQKELENGLRTLGVASEFDSCFGWSLVLNLMTGRDKPDVLHMHWTQPIMWQESFVRTFFKAMGVLTKLIIFKLYGVKIVWTVHNLLSHDCEYPKLEYFYNKRIAHIAHRIIAHAKYAKTEISRFYKVKSSKIVILPHGHYIQSYPNSMPRNDARTKLKLKDTDFVYLYFGLIREYKGIPELIKSFQSMNIPNTKLLIVGKANEQKAVEEIQRLAAGNPDIQFVFEYVPDDNVQLYMNASDIVVLPYRDIFTSGAVILGMSFAKAVIASRKGSIPEVLDPEGGFLFNSLGELTKVMHEARKKNRSRLEAMGQHNFEVVSRFDWQSICVKTHNVYKECFNG